MKPKVSVATITYNQSRYIAQSLDSSVGQETDFDYEIVVGDDYSTDGTRDILAKIAADNPAKVRVLMREKNLGMQWNYAKTLEECQGDYVAVLDGDDYWTSPLKLAKQVSFMEAHPEHVVSYHRCTVNVEQDQSRNHEIGGDSASVAGLDEILRENFMPSCSIMYRRSALPAFPDWYGEIATYDWVLHTLALSKGGSAGFIDENMAAYRKHSTSAWSSADEQKVLEREIAFFEKISKCVPPEYRAKALKGLSEKLYDLLNICRRKRDFKSANEAFTEMLKIETDDFTIPFRKKLRLRAWLALHI